MEFGRREASHQNKCDRCQFTLCVLILVFELSFGFIFSPEIAFLCFDSLLDVFFKFIYSCYTFSMSNALCLCVRRLRVSGFLLRFILCMFCKRCSLFIFLDWQLFAYLEQLVFKKEKKKQIVMRHGAENENEVVLQYTRVEQHKSSEYTTAGKTSQISWFEMLWKR